MSSKAVPLTRLGIALRFALLLRAGAAGCLGLGRRRLAVLLLVLSRAARQRRVLLALVQADLLFAAHTRDRGPAGAGPRQGGGTTTGDMQGGGGADQ